MNVIIKDITMLDGMDTLFKVLLHWLWLGPLLGLAVGIFSGWLIWG